MSCCGNNLLGGNNKVIKYYGSDLIAVDGGNTVAKLPLGDIRIPYKQVINSQIILKPGQTNYLLNFLGLGDNANLLAIAAKYDAKAKIEADNYVQYNYYDDFSRMYAFSSILTLSGNSTNRLKQLYLNNPNQTYAVTLNVMVATIDDTYSFFNATSGQDMAFSGLKYTDIITWVPGETIAILNPSLTPMAYIQLQNIASIERVGKILVLDDVSLGYIYLDFIDVFNAQQAHSLINWSMEGPNRVIQDLDPIADLLAPTIFFTNNVTLLGATFAGPYNSDQGDNFVSSTMSIATYSGAITHYDIINYTIDHVYDYRGSATGSTSGDGLIGLTGTSIIVTGTAGVTFNYITLPGTYSVTYNITDIAENSVSFADHVILNISL